MNVKIKYFASIREAVGKSEEVMETNALTLGDLFGEISQKYSLESFHHLKIARNEEYVSFDDHFGEMDTIALIPPVAGG